MTPLAPAISTLILAHMLKWVRRQSGNCAHRPVSMIGDIVTTGLGEMFPHTSRLFIKGGRIWRNETGFIRDGCWRAERRLPVQPLQITRHSLLTSANPGHQINTSFFAATYRPTCNL